MQNGEERGEENSGEEEKRKRKEARDEEGRRKSIPSVLRKTQERKNRHFHVLV